MRDLLAKGTSYKGFRRHCERWRPCVICCGTKFLRLGVEMLDSDGLVDGRRSSVYGEASQGILVAGAWVYVREAVKT